MDKQIKITSYSEVKVCSFDTDDIERNVLDDFYKNAPTEFSECVKSYKILKKNHYKENFDLEFFLERYKDLKYEKDNCVFMCDLDWIYIL